MRCVAFCDGASTGRVGPGGWGAVIISSEGTQELSGHEDETTNQRMEIMAAIQALEYVEPNSKVLVVSDSEYVVKYVRDGWREKWKRNGWRNSQKKPVKNRDLWERLSVAIERHERVSLKHMHGHGRSTEDEWYRDHNDRADQLAVEAKKQLIERKIA